MLIDHLRNATMMLTLGPHCLLVDPMLSDPGALPGFKLLGGGCRANPLVPLPPHTDACLQRVTGVLVTHEHPDHLDRAAVRWIMDRQLPVWAGSVDAPSLGRKGLPVHELRDGALGMEVEVVPARHGTGVVGWLMGPVSGFYLAHPDEPSVYITGDAVLTDAVLDAVERLRPEVVIAPAGAANFGLGGDILFSMDQLVKLARRAPGQVVLNHLEALDHCPVTRQALRRRVDAEEGVGPRVHIPADGQQLRFDRRDRSPRPEPGAPARRRPGLQKRLTALFSGA